MQAFCLTSILTYFMRIDLTAPVRFSRKKDRVVCTRNWSDAANIVRNALESRYRDGPHIGDSITLKYVHEEWEGQWQHHYKIVIMHIDTKCATCGFLLSECLCDSPVA